MMSGFPSRLHPNTPCHSDHARAMSFLEEWNQNGHVLLKGAIDPPLLLLLQRECDRLIRQSRSVCIRQVCQQSSELDVRTRADAFAHILPTGMRRVRSILFNKTREANWPVAWHQDLTVALRAQMEIPGFGPWSVKEGVLHATAPDSVLQKMLTLRIHLDDAQESNGALKVIPASHRHGRMTTMEIQQCVSEQAAVTCCCSAGDVLVMSPLLAHASERSRTSSPRRVLHLEFADVDALPAPLEWWEATGRD